MLGVQMHVQAHRSAPVCVGARRSSHRSNYQSNYRSGSSSSSSVVPSAWQASSALPEPSSGTRYRVHGTGEPSSGVLSGRQRSAASSSSSCAQRMSGAEMMGCAEMMYPVPCTLYPIPGGAEMMLTSSFRDLQALQRCLRHWWEISAEISSEVSSEVRLDQGIQYMVQGTADQGLLTDGSTSPAAGHGHGHGHGQVGTRAVDVTRAPVLSCGSSCASVQGTGYSSCASSLASRSSGRAGLKPRRAISCPLVTDQGTRYRVQGTAVTSCPLVSTRVVSSPVQSSRTGRFSASSTIPRLSRRQHSPHQGTGCSTGCSRRQHSPRSSTHQGTGHSTGGCSRRHSPRSPSRVSALSSVQGTGYSSSSRVSALSARRSRVFPDAGGDHGGDDQGAVAGCTPRQEPPASAPRSDLVEHSGRRRPGLCSSIRNSYRFWSVVPWATAALVIATLNVNILLYTLAHFGHSWFMLRTWLHSILISLAVGWGIVDVVVIIVRNNLRFMSRVMSRVMSRAMSRAMRGLWPR